MTWIQFWKAILLLTLSAYSLLVVVVFFGGLKNIVQMLKELRERRKVKVIVLACQIKSIPELVSQGLSEPMKNAIPRMCELVSKYWK